MKQKFTKEEIREVIQEIIGDYWHNLLKKALSGGHEGDRNEDDDTIHQAISGKPRHRDIGQKLLKKKKHSNDLDFQGNVEWFIYNFVDDRGYYSGPTMGNFNRHRFIRNPEEGFTLDDLETLKEWNLALAEKEGINKLEAYQANTDAQNHFYNVIMNRADSFPG